MLRKQVTVFFGGLLLAALLAYGIIHLLALRLERGDVYPPYSTLRADPLGAKAFYDSLASVDGLEVSRNYLELPKLRPAKPITLLYVGADRLANWRQDELAVFESLVAAGSHAVITFQPADRPSTNPNVDDGKVAKEKKDPEKTDNTVGGSSSAKAEKKLKPEAEDKARDTAKEKAKTKEKDDQEDDEEPGFHPRTREISFFDALKSWGCTWSFVKLDKRTAFSGEAKRPDSSSTLEPSLTWHSGFYFSGLSTDWQTLYTCDGKPVIIERPWGAGRIVLATDSYFASNEALRVERAPHLLASLVGPSNVVFDEAQHGLTQDMNLALLARKYGLQGAVAGLLLVGGLFVWRNVVRFVPPYDDRSASSEVVGGQNAAEGFVNLLRRSIPRAKLLETCADEWRRTATPTPAEQAKFEAAVAEANPRDPVAAYLAITERLKRTSTPLHPQPEQPREH